MKEVTDSEWQEQMPPEGPGKRLRILREAQELGRTRAASLLHLDENKLEALEKDDYEKLPGSVFVRGYLKNYARLLNVPADQILAQYDRIKPAEERRPNLQVASIKDDIGSGHLLVRIMTWGMIIGVIAMVAIWWRTQFDWTLLSETRDESVDIITEVDITDRTGLASLPNLFDNQPVEKDGETNLMLPPLTSNEDHPDLMQEVTTTTQPISEDEKIVPLPTTNSVPETETSDHTVVTPAIDSAVQPSSSGATAGEIIIELIDDCWVSIKDASGSFKIQNILKQGTQQVLKGDPPYKIVLGRASAVRLIVNGEVFDLAPFTQGDVARLTLNPDL